MLHLGRAVEEAPGSRYAAGRLAVIALDAALGPAADPKLAEAAVRASDARRGGCPGSTRPARSRGRAPRTPRPLARSRSDGSRRPRARSVTPAVVRDPLRSEARPRRHRRRPSRGHRRPRPRAQRSLPRRRVHGTVLALVGDLVLGPIERLARRARSRDPLFPAAYATLAQVAARQRGRRHHGADARGPGAGGESLPAPGSAAVRCTTAWRSRRVEPEASRATPRGSTSRRARFSLTRPADAGALDGPGAGARADG